MLYKPRAYNWNFMVFYSPDFKSSTTLCTVNSQPVSPPPVEILNSLFLQSHTYSVKQSKSSLYQEFPRQICSLIWPAHSRGKLHHEGIFPRKKLISYKCWGSEIVFLVLNSFPGKHYFCPVQVYT